MESKHLWACLALGMGTLWSACTPTENKGDVPPLSDLDQIKANITAEIRQKGLLSTPSEKMLMSGELVTDKPYQIFQNPPEIRAMDGELDTELRVAYANHQVYNIEDKAAREVRLRNYNGSIVGPTLRLNLGDAMKVHMVNALGTGHGECNPMEGGMHHMNHGNGDPCDQIDSTRFNITNLHTHGWHISPSGNADNVLVEIEPGCDFNNAYELSEDHAPGTFWYHAHVHGATAIQVSSGMGGALIVNGGLDSIPAIAEAKEQIMVFQQIPYLAAPDTLLPNGDSLYQVEDFSKSFGPGTWNTGTESHGWRTTINGQTYPIIYMKSGEVQRWRMIHAGVRETLNLMLDGHPIHMIAQDGIAMGEMVAADSVELEPGYRVDALIKAEKVDSATIYYLTDGEMVGIEGLQALPESPKVLAVVIVSPEEMDMPLPTQAELAPLVPYQPITEAEVEPYPVQEVKFNIDTGSSTTCFTINGKPFSMDNPPRLLTLNTANTWKLTSGRANHPYHIHVNHFQVISDISPEGDTLLFEKPYWKDTYLVRQDHVVTIRSRYTDFDGTFVLHCHLLDHEDEGMMELVKIVPDVQP